MARFVRADVHASEAKALEEFVIEKGGHVSHFGRRDDEFRVTVRNFLISLSSKNSEENINEIATLIDAHAGMVLDKGRSEAFWFTIRASLPNVEFVLPRWHFDGKYFGRNAIERKYVYTLKGDPTRFAKVKDGKYAEFDELERKFNQLDDKDFDSHVGKSIRKQLDDLVVENTCRGSSHIVEYFTGSDPNYYVRSEPVMRTSRLFESFVVGTYRQVKRLEHDWASNARRQVS